jgi:hypothetical protein
MSAKVVCPHCDSPNIRAMALRVHENESGVEWHECETCRRMWSVRKHPSENPTLRDTSEIQLENVTQKGTGAVPRVRTER